MDAILGGLASLLNWINDPIHKTFIAIAGGWLWNWNQATITKAAPAVLMGASAAAGVAQLVTALIATAFPGLHPAGMSVASFCAAAGQPSVAHLVVTALLGTALPPVIAVGAHSWPKNFFQWLADGAKLWAKA